MYDAQLAKTRINIAWKRETTVFQVEDGWSSASSFGRESSMNI